MAIRLRKIASDEKSLLAVTKRVEGRNVLWRRMRFLVVALLLGGLAVALVYGRYYRLSGVALVTANRDILASPGEAVVTWLAPKDAGAEVQAGEPLARIQVKAENVLAMGEALAEKRLERQRAVMMAADLAATIGHERKNLSQEEVELDTAVSLAQDALARGLVASRKAAEVLTARRREMENAESLRLLDALTEGDYLASRRMLAEAEAADERARLFEKSLRTEADGATETIARFRQGMAAKLAALETSLAEIQRFREEIDADILRSESLLAGQGMELELKAPSRGILLQPHCAVGQQLRQGQEVVSVYQPGSVRITAYVHERFKEKIAPGRLGRVRIAGSLFTAPVLSVRPASVYPPAELLRRELVPDNAYFFTVEMSPEAAGKPLLPGETGRVVFP